MRNAGANDSAPYLATESQQQLLDEEWQRIQPKSQARGHDRKALAGMALSGGGIRSAIFSLGGLQALARAGWLEGMDYLSTASGGGYIGSSLTWLLHKTWNIEGHEERFGTESDNFPYGSRRVAADQSDAETRSTSLLGFLRARKNYLFPGGGIGAGAAISVVLRGMVLNLFVYVSMLALLFMVWREIETHWLPGSASWFA